MLFSKAAVLFSILALSVASPIKSKKAGVLTVKSYADFQVSDGVAGNALNEVNANFPIDQTDLANVAASDLQIIKDARVVAESAETDTGGFNDEIAAASGDTTALQNGKIKNKVLKLQLEVLALQIEAAQGGDADQSKIDEETTKLNNNISLDQQAAGQDSVGVTSTFSG